MPEVYATGSDGKLDVFNQWAQTLLRERESTEQLAVELFNHEECYKHN